MAFFYYRQNNSGGKTYNNETVGAWVIMEHIDARWANDFVQECTNGQVYFDGCEIGKDCRCCGDRWNSVNKSGIYGLTEDDEKLYLPYPRSMCSKIKYYLIEDVLGKEIQLFFGPWKESMIHVYMKNGEHRMYSQTRIENDIYIFNRQI